MVTRYAWSALPHPRVIVLICGSILSLPDQPRLHWHGKKLKPQIHADERRYDRSRNEQRCRTLGGVHLIIEGTIREFLDSITSRFGSFFRAYFLKHLDGGQQRLAHQRGTDIAGQMQQRFRQFLLGPPLIE